MGHFPPKLSLSLPSSVVYLHVTRQAVFILFIGAVFMESSASIAPIRE